MSGAVLRLLKDVRPINVFLAVVSLLTLAVFDGAWLARSGVGAGPLWIFAVAFAFFPSAAYGSKFRIWSLLPVSAHDRRRARRWVWLGLPLIWILLAMAMAATALALFDGLRTVPLAAAKALGLQLLPAAVMAAVFGGAWGLRRRRRRFARTSPAQAAELLARLQARAGRKGARGWAALLPYALTVMGFALIAGATMSWWPLSQHRLPAPGSDGALPGETVMIIIVMWAIGGGAVVRAARVLRALPMGAVALTALLQGFVLVVGACAFACMFAVYLAAGAGMTRLLAFAGLAAPLMALRLPMQFRLGPRRSFWIYIALVLGVSVLPLIPGSAWPQVMAAGLVLTAGIWVWTWWELACARGAYRLQPAVTRRWQGSRAWTG